MNNNDYIRASLELHLFFDRIMKEHGLFLAAAFTDKDRKLKETALSYEKTFANLLKRSITLGNGNVSNTLLISGELVTKDTFQAEVKTNSLTGSNIDPELTRMELSLRPGQANINEQLLRNVTALNKDTLPLLKNFIDFQQGILNNVLSCKMYTTNYPLQIEHVINEAKMYYNLLTRIAKRSFLTLEDAYRQELFWNDIMKEHAYFIRGGLDPTEESLIATANQYAEEYKMIIKDLTDNKNVTNLSLSETISFRNFKVSGEEGILNCKIRSIIIPLLADHVVREANHFIRLLQTLTTRM